MGTSQRKRFKKASQDWGLFPIKGSLKEMIIEKKKKLNRGTNLERNIERKREKGRR